MSYNVLGGQRAEVSGQKSQQVLELLDGLSQTGTPINHRHTIQFCIERLIHRKRLTMRDCTRHIDISAPWELMHHKRLMIGNLYSVEFE
ncbi:MAG: hypothetical protein DME34_00160 [Verrucomicrobia bacterium]|nr:MAG: hypothetical protein DME34_00160 [Verrucomicrobiota bacterium]